MNWTLMRVRELCDGIPTLDVPVRESLKVKRYVPISAGSYVWASPFTGKQMEYSSAKALYCILPFTAILADFEYTKMMSKVHTKRQYKYMVAYEGELEDVF